MRMREVFYRKGCGFAGQRPAERVRRRDPAAVLPGSAEHPLTFPRGGMLKDAIKAIPILSSLSSLSSLSGP